MTADDGFASVRLRPLPAEAYEYQGRADEVPAVERLLGAPVKRLGNGDVVISCPAPRGKPPGRREAREAVLRPGMLVVRFDGPRFRFTVTDKAAYRFMYEVLGEEDGE